MKKMGEGEVPLYFLRANPHKRHPIVNIPNPKFYTIFLLSQISFIRGKGGEEERREGEGKLPANNISNATDREDQGGNDDPLLSSSLLLFSPTPSPSPSSPSPHPSQ